MPRYVRRRPYPRPARPYKKYGKKYGRRRYKKKSFAKNNINQLTMRAPLASRMLRVKLPWVKTFDVSIASAASQSFIFQGNGIIPYTVAGQGGILFNNPAVGDSIPAGETQYSSFYDRYFINGSSIKIEAINLYAAVNNPTLIRAVLFAVPFNTTGGNDAWAPVVNQLNSYTYEQLLAWPYAKWRMLGANTGGASKLVFKMFRKTKNMCGLKDLRDNHEYGANLLDGRTTIDPVENVNPREGFMYYLRFFNITSATCPLSITARMSLYVTMTHREFNPIQTITSP